MVYTFLTREDASEAGCRRIHRKEYSVHGISCCTELWRMSSNESREGRGDLHWDRSRRRVFSLSFEKTDRFQRRLRMVEFCYCWEKRGHKNPNGTLQRQRGWGEGGWFLRTHCIHRLKYDWIVILKYFHRSMVSTKLLSFYFLLLWNSYLITMVYISFPKRRRYSSRTLYVESMVCP